MDKDKIKQLFGDKTKGAVFPFKIKISCEGKENIDFEEFQDLQGNLKERTEEDIVKILKSIHDFGFSFPMFYSEIKNHKYTLDGHGRLLALSLFKEMGGVVPALPSCRIEAKNKVEAKQKLLRFNSHYGKINKDGFAEFISDIDLNFDDLEIPEINFDSFLEKEESEKNIDNIKIEESVLEADILQNEKFYFAFSGGKDSLLSLFKMAPVLKKEGKLFEVIYIETGVEFPDMLSYVHRITEMLDAPLKVLNSRRNFFDIYYKKKVWPDSIFRDCIENLINDPMDRYCAESKEPYVLIRGGRSNQKTRDSKSAKIQKIKSKPLLTIYNPLYDMKEEDFQKEIEQLPLWQGYAKGFDRTACWCCPFQQPTQWEALKIHYPFLWDEMQRMTKVVAFKDHKGDGNIKKFRKYWGDIKTC